MGIRPRKSGSYLPPVPDNSTSRWGSWVDDLDSAGGTAGEGFEEIDAKASSGNAGVSELATRVAGLERRVEELETRVSDLEPLVGRVNKTEALLKHAVIAVPPANLNELASGQVYLDQETGTVHRKP